MATMKCLLAFVMYLLASSTVMGQQCEQDEQVAVQRQYGDCIATHTNKFHESFNAGATREQTQSLTCQMLKETTECGDLWKRCHREQEVRHLKDNQIASSIEQYRGNGDGLDLRLCPVVREYLESGRAHQKSSDQDKCTNQEVTMAQTDFQKCNYDQSGVLWESVQELRDVRAADLRKASPRVTQNDIDAIDADEDFLTEDVKPLLCQFLNDNKCTDRLQKCFTREDSQEMHVAYVSQMRDYYSDMYPGITLHDCVVVQPVAPFQPERQPQQPNRPTPEPVTRPQPTIPPFRPEPTTTTRRTTTTRPSEPTENPFDGFEDPSDEDEDTFGGLDYPGETNEIGDVDPSPNKKVNTRSENNNNDNEFVVTLPPFKPASTAAPSGPVITLKPFDDYDKAVDGENNDETSGENGEASQQTSDIKDGGEDKSGAVAVASSAAVSVAAAVCVARLLL